MSASWVDGLIRCPVNWENVSVFINESSASGGSSASSSSSADSGFALPGALPWVKFLDSSEVIHRFEWEAKPNDAFPFATTMTLMFGIALLDIALLVLTLWKFHGFGVFAAPRSSSAGTRPGDSGPVSPVNQSVATTSVANNTLLANTTFAQVRNDSITAQLRQTLQEESTPLVARRTDSPSSGVAQPYFVKIVTKPTSNLMWACYFGALFVVRAISGGSLLFAALCGAGCQSHAEALRITQLFQRIAHGLSCVWLAVALNVQRLHRSKDNKHAKANATTLRHATYMNRFCFAVFIVFVVGDFVASHIIVAASSLTTDLFWVSVGAQLLMAVPPVFSTVWVVLHESFFTPSRVAKAILALGVLLHVVVEFPPDFWNTYAFKGFVSAHPCPLTYLSLYDLVLVLTVVATLLLFVFMVLEHRRTSALAIKDYLQFCEARLYRRLARQGQLQPKTSDAAATGFMNAKARSSGGKQQRRRVAQVSEPRSSLVTIDTPLASGRDSAGSMLRGSLLPQPIALVLQGDEGGGVGSENASDVEEEEVENMEDAFASFENNQDETGDIKAF